MVKITKSGDQYRINIPQYIIELTGWDESTELAIFPWVEKPDKPITSKIPIILRKKR